MSPATDQNVIRVRLLGTLSVVRLDGSLVPVEQWRTGKTMDLLRILALAGGRPVRASTLIDRLWPTATVDRGRGSLRTAASQIRRAVGVDCVARQPEGLVLRGAWVDTVDFLGLATSAHLAARAAQHTTVLALTRTAEELYTGDFRAYDDDGDWARTERHRLRQARQQMLAEAAASALELQLAREALDLATVAVRLDTSSESAHRSLMQAHAELGEIGSALRVFETYRAHLADELGADPSMQTRELHLRLLRGSR